MAKTQQNKCNKELLYAKFDCLPGHYGSQLTLI